MYDGSQPLGVLTPSCRDSKISRPRSVTKFHGYLTSESAESFTNRDRPQRKRWGLRRAVMEAPHTYGRISSGTSSLSRRLTTTERSRRSRSEEPGRSASRTCEGRSPDRPAPEVEGNDRRALRTWSTSAEGAAPGAIRQRVSISKRSSTGREVEEEEAERSDDVIRGTDRGGPGPAVDSPATGLVLPCAACSD